MQARSPRILTSFLGKPFPPNGWFISKILLGGSQVQSPPWNLENLVPFVRAFVVVFPCFLVPSSFPQKTIRCSKQARYKLSEAEPLFSRALEGRQRKLGVNHPDTWWKWSCFYVVNLNKLLLKHLQKRKDFPSKCLSFEVWSMIMFSMQFHQKQKKKKGMDLAETKKRKARQFLIQVENFQDTLEVMNNLAKLLQVPWMGIAGSCFIDVLLESRTIWHPEGTGIFGIFT